MNRDSHPRTDRATRSGPSPEEQRAARRLARGYAALVAVTFSLIVLGALVRAHEAGLACPDWPRCFGVWIPEMNFEVAFEVGHRALAGSVALAFVGLAAATLRRPGLRRVAGPWLGAAAALLAVQVVLGGLTVLHLLASWTVTSHLLTGNAFNVALLGTAWRLRELASPARRGPVGRGARLALGLAAGLLVLQMGLGGLVSSTYAGMACPEWPTCNGGLWFPAWGGSVGLHLLHRLNGYALLAALGLAALACRGLPGLGRLTGLALVLGLGQVVVGISNVLLGIPVEVTGLHSALAAALVLSVAGAAFEAAASTRRAEDPVPDALPSSI